MGEVLRSDIKQRSFVRGPTAVLDSQVKVSPLQTRILEHLRSIRDRFTGLLNISFDKGPEYAPLHLRQALEILKAKTQNTNVGIQVKIPGVSSIEWGSKSMLLNGVTIPLEGPVKFNDRISHDGEGNFVFYTHNNTVPEVSVKNNGDGSFVYTIMNPHFLDESIEGTLGFVFMPGTLSGKNFFRFALDRIGEFTEICDVATGQTIGLNFQYFGDLVPQAFGKRKKIP